MNSSEAISAVPMTIPAPPRLRLWPGVIIVIAMAIVLLGPAILDPGSVLHMYSTFLGPMVSILLFFVWWLCFSRIAWSSRLLGLAGFAVGVGVIAVLRHQSFEVMAGIMFATPVVFVVWVAWLVFTPLVEWTVRLAGLMLVIVATWGAFTLFRFEGMNGAFVPQFVWRFRPEPSTIDRPQGALVVPVAGAGDWPAFRGPNRDAVLRGVRILPDWTTNPPKELWRQPVGKGWGSFAVIGKSIYTQEQRGPREAVVCLDADTGDERWAHLDDARFEESVAGPGPRATPTFHQGKVYTQGAKGAINCLDAGTGAVLWSRDIYKDAKATELPPWGYSASPLVVGDVVVTIASKKAVLGYDAATGELRWTADEPAHTYTSPHRAVFGGVEQVLVTTERGVASFDPKTGARLWTHDWPLMEGMSRVTQPQLLSESDLLFGAGFGFGLRRVHVQRNADDWTASEAWTSKAIKPYFNDGVIHEGHFYGFDGPFFVCIDAETGKGKWRARGYGNGQVLSLADQGILLILSETGDVATVEAKPDAHKEIGRFTALEGKTWNHPVITHGHLYVRNGVQAACYELATK